MWLLIGICIMIVTTECTDMNGLKTGENFAANWEASKPPNIFKLPEKILFLSTPYISNTQQWNKILPMKNNQSGRGIATSNEIVGNNESTYSMMKFQSSGSALPEWLLTRNIDSEKERRNPSFSPWGGKRSSSTYKADPRIRRPSRVPFNSWGGKRNYLSFNRIGKSDANTKHFSMINLPGIKKPFNSWGGKRTPIVIEYLLNLSSRDMLKHIWQSTHAPLTSTSIDGHTNRNFLTDNDQDSGTKENRIRIMIEPWNREKTDANSIGNDIFVASVPNLHYTQ